MTVEAGHFALVLAFALSLAQCVLPFWGARTGNERLMAPAFVAFYWLLALIIQRDIWPSKWLLGIIAVGSFVASLHYQQARFPLPSRELTVILGGLAWLMVTGAALVFRLQQWRRGPSPV